MAVRLQFPDQGSKRLCSKQQLLEMNDRYGAPPPPPPPPPMSLRMAENDYPRGMRSPPPPPPSRYRSPSPRRYRSRSPPRYRSRSRSPPPRRYHDFPRGGERKRAPAPVYRGTEEERARSTTLFVGNLPYGFEERDVVGLFERFGRLRQVYVPIDRYTRRNKGFAFVSFEQRLDAEDASFKYNGYMLEGRKLRIDWDIGVERKDHLRAPHSPRQPNNGNGPTSGDDYHPPRSPPRDYGRRERSPGPRGEPYGEYR